MSKKHNKETTAEPKNCSVTEKSIVQVRMDEKKETRNNIEITNQIRYRN
ncbi:hypothetical protein HanPSC8_Chr17g0779651 [Helianthus annuus]|nr:hypothetical protein HanPSC8_Chr17g0779651 [Helianthus annuus]